MNSFCSRGSPAGYLLQTAFEARQCFPLGQREFVFAVWVNEDNISLQGDVQTGLLTASYKKAGHPKFRVPQL